MSIYCQQGRRSLGWRMLLQKISNVKSKLSNSIAIYKRPTSDILNSLELICRIDIEAIIAEYLSNADWINWRFNGLCSLIE